jgi:hypothetical protein
MMIDRKAIIESLKKPEVYVVRDNKACKQPIITGKVFDSHITIVSGLEKGDTVVVAGQINLVDGRDVEIIE